MGGLPGPFINLVARSNMTELQKLAHDVALFTLVNAGTVRGNPDIVLDPTRFYRPDSPSRRPDEPPSPVEVFLAIQALGNPMAAAGSNNPAVERFRQIREMYPSLPAELADAASSLPLSTEVLDRLVTQEAQRRAIQPGRR